MRGRVAIVTGAAHGIGLATAEMLAERSARVVIADVDDAAGEEAARRIGAQARFRHVDVADERCWTDVVAFAKSELGGLDIVVNNAGVPLLKPLDESTAEDWMHVFRVNALGVFLGCKHAVLAMRKNGGAIVNVSSNSSVVGMRRVPLYSSAKGAVNALTRSVAAHCRQTNLPIRCNTVIPGGTRSKMAREAFLTLAGVDIDSEAPAARAVAADLAPPESVAAAIVFLASDEARRINGAELLVDGASTLTFPS